MLSMLCCKILEALNMTIFSDKIKSFIENSSWTFSKTYAKTCPHEYIVQEKVDNDLFVELAKQYRYFW